MYTSFALVHHANQFLITDGYDNREGLATVLGEQGRGGGMSHILALHARYEVPFNLHLSGTLLEAIAWHSPWFLDQLRELHRAGFVEFIGSCYGQNIMRFFDADFNLRQMNEELLLYQVHLDADPREMQVFWPPERVWETARMASVLRDARLGNNGYRYVLVDDRVLLSNQDRPLTRDTFDENPVWNADLFGMYEIESGLGLMALPIATKLRRSIPPRAKDEWMSVQHDLEALLVEAAGDGARNRLAIYADDMEKVSGIWGEELVAQYERFLQWLSQSTWIRPVKLTHWASVNHAMGKRRLQTGTFAELAKEFEAGEGYERWFHSPAWAPYQAHFSWAEARVRDCSKAGADAGLMALAQKQLLVSVWETAWHTPATGAHGDQDPENNGRPSPWARAIASHSRHAAVIAEAAYWMAHRDGRPHAILTDIDNDGEEEIVLKNDAIFAVITAKWGGRIVALFSLAHDRGAMMVGNPCDDWNFMEELNRFMEVPRNHPGCCADVGHENVPFKVLDLQGDENAAIVTLKGQNGITKLFNLAASSLDIEYRIPQEIVPIEIDFGLSPDYLSLLRAGSVAMQRHQDGRKRGCTTSGLSIDVVLPDVHGVDFLEPPNPGFGHGWLVRMRSRATQFQFKLEVSRLSVASVLPEAA